MDNELTNTEKIRALPWGVAFSVCNTVFAQYTYYGSIFVLFLNEMSIQKAQIGSLLALLPFMAILAIFLAPLVERFGLKRSFVLSYSIRLVITLLLLAAPFVYMHLGKSAVIVLITAIIGAFGFLTTIAYTAFNPWLQEHIPDEIRGKNSAIKNAISSLFGFIAMLIAGYVLGPDPGFNRFLILITAGTVIAAAGVWSTLHIPGGESNRDNRANQASLHDMAASVRDVNFIYFLSGLALVSIAIGPQISFVPLFMKEQVGLSANQVVWLETGSLMGGLASSYLWGWLADRYGSKPITLFSILMLAVLPLGWLFIPRHFSGSIYLALGIAMWSGTATAGWIVGYWRLLCSRVAPVEKRTAYMAVYYACIGAVGGLGQLTGGFLVELSSGLSGRWWILMLDPYTILFGIGVISPMIAFLLFRRVQPDSTVSMGQFAGLFLRGNPFLALEGLIRYYRARDEKTTVAVTERLGATRSPLAVEELLQALQDPRFFVRFEAVMSISRCKRNPVLTAALIETLEGNEPALSTISAWALGKIGDRRALGALRRGLNAPYRSIQVHCIRSLGSMGDHSVAPVLLERLIIEKDPGLLAALATALSQLQVDAAAAPIMALLRKADEPNIRAELATSLARLTGSEHRFVHLQRLIDHKDGAGLSRAMNGLKKKMPLHGKGGGEIETLLADAAGWFERSNYSQGVQVFLTAIRCLAARQLDDSLDGVIRECMDQMDELSDKRDEYFVLAMLAVENLDR